uniref:Uncharacterized protein n=1 Tax=Populus alba TaxID=43335 RepID=A0A4U5MB08_POPAL|nr:hypothetical protein D5086_0000312650 [Populus alba]
MEEKGVLSGCWFWLEIGIDLWALLCVGCCERPVAKDEEESVARALLWVGCWPSGEDGAATAGGENRLRVESRAARKEMQGMVVSWLRQGGGLWSCSGVMEGH